MKKKVLAVLLTAAMAVSMVACGGSKQTAATETASVENVEETAVTTDTDGDLQAALDELAATLDGTCWVGMDSEDYTCYAMGFGDGQVGIYTNIEGDEGIEGYWNIGTDSLFVYDDEACTNQIYEIPWSYDEENEVMVLNDRAVMAQVDGDIETAGAAMEQYAAAAQVGEFLDSTVWAGADENASMVMAFTLKDGQYYMGIVDAEGNSEEHTGAWSIDYDSIYLYDENDTLIDTLSWAIAEDGSELYFTVDSSQVTFGLIQSDADNVEDSLAAIAAEVFSTDSVPVDPAAKSGDDEL